MFRKILKTMLYLFIMLILIIVIKTALFTSKQVKPQKIKRVNVTNNTYSHLSEAIQIHTISYENDKIDSIQFEKLQHLLSLHFPKVHKTLTLQKIDGASLLYTWKGKKNTQKPIMFLAHQDVVPVDSSAIKQWTFKPYGGEITREYICGRGSLDDKVSIWAMFEAVETLIEKGFEPERTIYFGFGHDEETKGEGAQAIASYLNSKNIQLDFVLDEGMTIVSDVMPGVHKPLALIGIAEKASFAIKLVVKGEGGHSSMPPQQTNIGILAAAINKLNFHPFDARNDIAVNTLFDYVGPEMSQPMKSIIANRWLFSSILNYQLAKGNSSNAILRTTLSPTIIHSGIKSNVLPNEAYAIINVRALPGDSPEKVIEKLKNIINDNNVNIVFENEGYISTPNEISDIENENFIQLQQQITNVFPDCVVAPSLSIAATDSRHYFKLTKNIYRFLPIRLHKSDLSRIHGIDERISKENYNEIIQFYYQMFQMQ